MIHGKATSTSSSNRIIIMTCSWTKIVIWLVVFECKILFCHSEEIISLPIGQIRGRKCTTRSGRDLNCWLGIPYARPPLGNLRFAPPKPVKSWKGVFNATKDGAACVQHLNLNPGKKLVIAGSENCLTLSVYFPKPKTTKCKRKVPVMVYIHGGGFYQGSKYLYGPEYICDKACVGLVTINYRLDCFGFLCTGDKEVPGNQGLKDQVMALEWVNRYIEHFGGDPTQVTTFGESAGGCSVDMLFFSKYSKDLMQRGIVMAGTAYANGALTSTPDPEQVSLFAKSLATLLGCPTNSSRRMVKCLREIPAYDLISIQAEISKSLGIPPFVAPLWIPTLDYEFTDDPFFECDPRTTPDRPKQPMINGGTINDGTYFVCLYSDFEHFFNKLRAHPAEYIPLAFGFKTLFPEAAIRKVTDKILLFYFGNNQTIGDNQTANLVDFATDLTFVFPAVLASLNHGGPVWQYLLEFSLNETYDNIFGYPGRITTTPGHSDILLLLYRLKRIFPVRNDSITELRVSEKLVQLWTNFAIYGEPTPNECDFGLKWDTIGTEDSLNYMIIDEEFRQEINPLHERVLFWRSLYKEFGVLYANNTCNITCDKT